MANCHNSFQNYNQTIKLSDDKRTMLIAVRNSLRQRMNNTFLLIPESERDTHSIEFQTQGSFVMDTIIRPINDDYDLDDGVYFQGNISVERRAKPQIFHDLIIKTIDKNHIIEEIIDKPTCVRVKYKNSVDGKDLGFHIDLPIYYADNFHNPDLADTLKGWTLSNPVEFIAWFEEKTKSGFEKAFLMESLKYAEPFEKWLSDIRKKDCQIRKIVRYMKSWADLKKEEMPSGIIMTILVANNYSENERDDIALRDTLVNIEKYLNANNFKCPRPTTPIGEDLFATYSDNQKKYFQKALSEFINAAKQAIEMELQNDACKKWQQFLGERFTCIKENKDLSGLRKLAQPMTPEHKPWLN